MRELSTPEFDQFRQLLKFYDENMLGNLSPFFDAKLFTLESRMAPASIIASAYPETLIEKAQINQYSQTELDASIRDFFSHIADIDGRRSSEMADAFINGPQSCISFGNCQVWEYVPDWRDLDELYDYIAYGFTYIIVNRDEMRSLIVHGGYMD